MKNRHLEVSRRKGKPLAAYLYLPRETSGRSARTERAGEGLLVDYAADGHPIGVEITAPGLVSINAVNDLLERLGVERLQPEEIAELQVARAALDAIAEAGEVVRPRVPKQGWSWKPVGLGLPWGTAARMLDEARAEDGAED